MRGHPKFGVFFVSVKFYIKERPTRRRPFTKMLVTLSSLLVLFLGTIHGVRIIFVTNGSQRELVAHLELLGGFVREKLAHVSVLRKPADRAHDSPAGEAINHLARALPLDRVTKSVDLYATARDLSEKAPDLHEQLDLGDRGIAFDQAHCAQFVINHVLPLMHR